MRFPDFIILGEQKCGTTTLWSLLSRHPRVFFSAEKELHFFASYRALGCCGRAMDGDLDRYAEQFAEAPADALCGEATPNYLSDPEAPNRIAELVPDVRTIVILRDPVERALSHYWHQVRRGIESESLRRALELEPRRLAEGDADDFEKYTYATRGHYIRGIERYSERLGRDRVLVLFLSDLKRDRATTVERVLDHLGLEACPAMLEDVPHQNRANYPKWPAVDRVAGRLVSAASSLGPAVDKPIKALGRATRRFRKYEGKPPQDPEANTRLRETYAESDKALAEWLGRPLPWARAESTEGAA